LANGTVRWFNDPCGYGYIASDEGGKDLFVHRGSIAGIARNWRERTLAEGDRVKFELREGGMMPEAIGVSHLASSASESA
jgi:cold shock protein